MIKNILIYIAVLSSVFVFNIFYYAWFSWILLVLTVCIPFISLIFSLPFMISTVKNGVTVFTKEKINIGDDFIIGFSGNQKRALLCPQLKIDIKAENIFSDKKEKLKFRFGGYSKMPVFQKYNKLSKNCGQVSLIAKHCKVYDLTGIFCIPVKINCDLKCNVMPKEKIPDLLPECDLISVVGYKPKSGGGYSDIYELKQYQNGDSLKNIHWKLSSKFDDIIVREPSVPIYRQIIVRVNFSDDCDSNDDMLARFVYACKYVINKSSVCFAFSNNTNCISELKNDDELTKFILSIYANSEFKSTFFEQSGSIFYTVGKSGEEVSES